MLRKQLVFLFLISSITNSYAQTKTVYHGSPRTGGAQVHLSEDNKYDVVLKQGNHGSMKHRDKEYTYLDNIDLQQEGFKVTEDDPSKKTDSITINFMIRNIILDEENIYIGYKQKGEVNYVNLCYETLLFNTENVEPFGRNLSFKIPRTKHLELILKNGNFFVDRFELSPNCANVYVDYHYIGDKQGDNSKLLIYEKDSEERITINDNLFSTNNPPSNYVKRIASDSIIDWKLPLLIQKEAYKKFDDPKLSYRPVTTISTRPRNSELSEFKSLEDAISTLKNDNSKVLLIFNSLLGNNDLHYFHDTLDDGYKNTADKYLFYFMKPDDLEALKPYTSEGIQEVIALNSDLEIVYKENIGAQNFYWKYNGINTDFSQKILATNMLKQFNRKIDSKTLTAKDFVELGVWRRNIILKNAMPDIASNHNAIDPSYIRGEKPSPRFRTKVDFNYPSIEPEKIKDGLHALIEKHKSDQTIDIDFATLAFDFISFFPFYEDISGIKGSFDPQKEHYEFCLYLSRFPIETARIQNEHTRNIQDHFETIKELLEKERNSKNYPELVIPTYENLVGIERYRHRSIFIYYFYLFNQDKLAFEDFDTLFKEMVPENNEYERQLRLFHENCDNCPYIDSLKYYITTLGNAMAWKAVKERNTQKALLLQALEWSKLSVEIAPEHHYYTDTYAHLEYFLGNIEKAIALESKAIMLAGENEDKNLSEYKATLVKMKNGTLKF